MSVITVYAVFSDADEAARIGRQCVEDKLAACVNVLGPCHSIYRWQGKIEEGSEVPALFKTDRAVVDALIARISELHSYDVPAVVAWPIERLNADYADWVETTVHQ